MTTPQQQFNLATAIQARAHKIADELCEESPDIALTSAIAVLVIILARVEPTDVERMIRDLPETLRDGIATMRSSQ
jgi:hypothetical protein